MIEIRVGQLADRLGVHRNTVTNWIRSGKLRATATVGKKYLIEKEALLRFCREQGIPEGVMQAVSEFSPIPSTGNAHVPHSPYPHTLNQEVTMSAKPIGSVLVVGGGIAGMQATLDLANSGYYVHVVEKSAGIGGVMSQLDKTFPTNDCAM
ncbi:MAG: excisionase family DNA-binding protein [Desulfobacterales bacterium]|jgi:excisionase family DNA binding protein|nr:excisionase family DNA-binding protein [Desulfobacterales bacterium]